MTPFLFFTFCSQSNSFGVCGSVSNSKHTGQDKSYFFAVKNGAVAIHCLQCVVEQSVFRCYHRTFSISLCDAQSSYACILSPFTRFDIKGTNGRQKTYEIFHVYCVFYSGFTCQTTVIFGITKDGSLVLTTLAS